MKLEFDIQKYLPLLNRYKGIVATVAVLAICGYTGYQISVVFAVTPDAATIAQEQAKVDTKSLKFDTKTITAITQQTSVNVAPNLGGIGTTNPFFGN